MTVADEELDQDEINRLLAESGTHLAFIEDGRYKMRLNRRAGALWLVIEGLVMQPVPEEFSTRLMSLCQGADAQRAIVDLRRCTYLCSSALGLLAVMFQASNTSGYRVMLLGASDKILKMINLIGLGDLVDQVEDEASAIRVWHAKALVRRNLDPRFQPCQKPPPRT